MSLSQDSELFVFSRDKNTCQGCKKKFPNKYQVSPQERIECRVNYLVVDHIDSSAGDDPSNLQTLCQKCNAAKAGKSKNSFQLHMALKRLGPCVVYYPSLARLVGLKESIFLCQLIYWTPKGRHDKGDGWIYKSVEEMEEETGLTYKEQIRLRKSLIDQGLLDEKYERESHNLYFKVNAENLDRKGEHITNGHMPESYRPSDQSSGGTLPKVSSYKEQEITHNTTQENTSPAPFFELNSETTKSKRDQKKERVIIPEWMPLAEWDAWLEVRDKKKCPNTNFALNRAIEKLDGIRISGGSIKAVLNRSILNGWKDVFEIKPEYSNGNNHQAPPEDALARERRKEAERRQKGARV